MFKFGGIKKIFHRAITCVIVFFAIISIIIGGFFIVYTRTYVKGLSMYPTLNTEYSQSSKKDIVYINKFNNGDVGDIVVLDLRKHASFGNYSVKRLIAKEGDIVNIVIDIDNNKYDLLVNEKLIYSKQYQGFECNTYSCFESYVNNHLDDSTRISKNADDINGIIVKKGEVFVLGDNWEHSKDSSLVGPLDKNLIVGRVDIVVKPGQNEFLAILKRIF